MFALQRDIKKGWFHRSQPLIFQFTICFASGPAGWARAIFILILFWVPVGTLLQILIQIEAVFHWLFHLNCFLIVHKLFHFFLSFDMANIRLILNLQVKIEK